jgi:hypothetical protein
LRRPILLHRFEKATLSNFIFIPALRGFHP